MNDNTRSGGAADELDPRTFRTELIRADVAALVGLDLGTAPGGGPATWELTVDAARVAVTDEAMTDRSAQAWARRMLGEGVVFWPGRLGGGYWVATPDQPTSTHPGTGERTERPARIGRGWV